MTTEERIEKLEQKLKSELKDARRLAAAAEHIEKQKLSFKRSLRFLHLFT